MNNLIFATLSYNFPDGLSLRLDLNIDLDSCMFHDRIDGYLMFVASKNLCFTCAGE